MRFAFSALTFVWIVTPAVAGDAERGAQVLRRENCLACHSIHGDGGHSAPDLGRRATERYTPAVLASVMWNHAPAMWTAMAAKTMTPPSLTAQDSDDLFAYFLSIRSSILRARPGAANSFSSKKPAPNAIL
jgi:mono/diheme cytochrome c family protein